MRGIGDKPYKYLLDFNIFVFDINLLNYRQDQLKGSGITLKGLTVFKIKIEGHLVQHKLEAALKEIVGDAWVGREVAIPESKLRWNIVYKHNDKMVAVEFDGDQHYRDALVIKRDREKDNLAILFDYKLIRIPYWVQLTTETLKFYFDLDAEIDQNFPHGFITTKIFPASFCDLGVVRFQHELSNLPDRVQDDVMESLETQAKKHGFSYVLPTTVGLWLNTPPCEPNFYKKPLQLLLETELIDH